MVQTEDLLGSLATISSILVGFGLAALVQLATEENREYLLLQWTKGVWMVSSLLLLAVLIAAETLRRSDVPHGRVNPPLDVENRLWERSQWLLATFALALAGTAAGVVLLGFYFSWLNGIAGCIAVALGLLLLRRIL